MKEGSKYYPLFEHLRASNQTEITLTIPEIEILINGTLPKSAQGKKAWWSNRDSKGALQASAWINAGYHVEVVDLDQQTVTFCKFSPQYKIQHIEGEIVWNHDAVKALRHQMNLTQEEFAKQIGVRRQTVSEWENGVYQPDRSTSKHLEMVAERVAFNYESKN